MLNKTETKLFLEKRNWFAYSNSLKAQHPDLIEHLKSEYPQRKISEQLWLYINDLCEPPSCLVCSKHSRFKNIKLGYSDFCGSKECFSIHRKANSKDVLAAAKQSSTPPQCEHPQCNNSVGKNAQGLWKKYCSFDCRGQHNSLKSRDKAKETWIEKHGVDHPRKSAKINEKLKQKWMDSHGVDNPAKLDWVQEKMRATCLEKYGNENGGHLNPHHQNENLYMLKDKEELEKLSKQKSPLEIANLVGTHVNTVYTYLKLHGFMEAFKSHFEKEVVEYISSIYDGEIIENNRTILNGKELDIYLPDINLAIECNGLFWHSDKIKDEKSYHRDKFINCEQKGIHLITIFNDMWDLKKSIVKKILFHKLGKEKSKIYARNCTLKKIKNTDLKSILENNHIQGFTGASYAYALYHDGEIVAGMSFSKPRLGIGKSKDKDCYELVRFVSSAHVIGAASKLITAFIREVQPNTIISYSDNEWSKGDLYNKLGFSLKSDLPAGYWYLSPDCKKRYHRFRFAKYRLVKEGFDPNKTEKQIMVERKFFRIWDCGKRTWVLTLKS